jgi:type III secretion protein U
VSEKTEQPTPKKLREAREKGQVAQSREVGSAAVIVTVMVVFILRFEANLDRLCAFYGAIIEILNLPFREALPLAMGLALNAFFFVTVPPLAAAPVAGIVAHTSQVGMLLAFKGAMPSLDKLSPQNWINKVFSKKALVELARTLVKVVLLGWILYSVVLDNIDPLMKSGLRTPAYFLGVFSAVMMRIFLWVVLVFSAVAAVDFMIQKRMFTGQMMMSKDEVKREYKEMEGDPHIKSQRRQLHQEMVMNNAIHETRKSSVLIVNPMRIAVALYYEEGKTPLPVIAAMGQGSLAKAMRKAAEEEGIPVMENVPLARDLLETGETGNYIPPELIDPVAEVMRWVNEAFGDQKQGRRI